MAGAVEKLIDRRALRRMAGAERRKSKAALRRWQDEPRVAWSGSLRGVSDDENLGGGAGHGGVGSVGGAGGGRISHGGRRALRAWPGGREDVPSVRR